MPTCAQALDRVGLALQGEQGVRETVSRHRAVANLGSLKPSLPRNGFIAPNATIAGAVELGERSSVWYGAVLRGDVNNIKIGGACGIHASVAASLPSAQALPGACKGCSQQRRRSAAAYTNIQDQCVIHVAKNNVGGKARPTVVGSHVTVGHGAILHACTIEDGAFVGMGATIMDGAVVQSGAMVAAVRACTLGWLR